MARSKRSAKKETPKTTQEDSSSEEIIIIPRKLKFSPSPKSLNVKRKAEHSSDEEEENGSSLSVPTIVIEGIGSEPLDDEPELPKKKQKLKNTSPSPKRSPRSRTPRSPSRKLLSPNGYSSSEEGRSRSRSPSKTPQQKNEEQILVNKIISLSHLLPPIENFSPQKIDVWFLKQSLLQLLPEYQKHNHQDIHLPTRKLPLLQMTVAQLLHKEKFSSIDVIPNKVWLNVFKWLRPIPDLICAKSTCARWYNLIDENPMLWDEVSLRQLRVEDRYHKLRGISNGDKSVGYLLKKYCLYINAVDVVGMKMSSVEGLEDLIATRLRLLRLPKITKQQFSSVCKIINSSSLVLEEIDLSAITVTEEENLILDSLTQCKNLKKLALPRGCNIHAEFVSSLPKLYYIDMIGSSYTVGAFKLLSKRVSSLAFGFEHTGYLGEAILLGSSVVRHLRINSNKFKDGEIYYVMKQIPELESLTLENASKMTEKGFRKIVKYGKNLRKLAIHTGKINDRVMNLICSNCVKLKVLVLEKATVTDSGIVPPLLLPELQYFALVNCSKVTKEGIANFKFVEEETKKHQLKPIKTLFTNKFPEDTDFFDPIAPPEQIQEDTDETIEQLTDTSNFVLSDDEKK